MNRNTLGVLGGMGPFATSVFFERVIERTKANKDQDHLDMVILNHASLPDRTESILNNEPQEFLQLMEQDIKLLEQAGVDHIAIPCNTSHYFYDKIQNMTHIPIIHMVQSTVQYVYKQVGANKKIAVLATNGTVKSEVYQHEIRKINMELHPLDDTTQEKVMDIIYRIKGNLVYKTEELDYIIGDLVQNHGCTTVILACTELSTIALKEESKRYCIDALDVLVRESIIRSNLPFNE